MYISSNPTLPIGALLGIGLPKRSELESAQSNTRVHGYSQAREAVADFTGVVKMKPGDSVLVPAYICSSVIDPFQRLGIRVLFYPVNRSLAPDVRAIRKLLPQKPTAILIVHYFGFSVGVEDLIQECRENGLWIIEDCAHTLPPTNGARIGRLGDLTIYSLAKLLPVPDGALVLVNNPDLVWPESPTRVNRRLVLVNMAWQAANTLEVRAGLSIRTRLRDRRTAARMITGLREPSFSREPSASNGSLGPYHRFRMSRLTQRIHERIGFVTVTSRRKENYELLKAAIKSVKGATPVFGDLDPAGAPLGFPITVDHREAVRLKLIAAGVDPRPVWSGLPPQVPSQGFEDARYIAAHNIVLPVHQDLSQKELAYIVSALDCAIATSL